MENNLVEPVFTDSEFLQWVENQELVAQAHDEKAVADFWMKQREDKES
jgi:hypothetical protein